MVLPTPAPDAELRAEAAWIAPILRTLRLSGRNGVLIHVDHAIPARLGQLARALLPERPDLDVLHGAERLQTAPEGAALILIPRPTDATALNLMRPIVTRLNLQIVLWCDHATTVELAQHAPDFFDWVSTHVDCPDGLPPFALAGFRAAGRAKTRGIHWIGEDIDHARTSIEHLVANTAPGSSVRWIRVEGDYDDVLDHLKGTAPHEWAATVADEEWKVWRFRWAAADARTAPPRIVVAPQLPCPGFWPIEDRTATFDEVDLALPAATTPRAGLLAALLDLEPSAVALAGRLLTARSLPAEEMVSLLAPAPDPGVALSRFASTPEHQGILLPGDPSTVRAAPPRPAGDHASRTEAAIEGIRATAGSPTEWTWFTMAESALALGDSSAAISFARREQASFATTPGETARVEEFIRQAELGDVPAAWRAGQELFQLKMARRSREVAIPEDARWLVEISEKRAAPPGDWWSRVALLGFHYASAGLPATAEKLLFDFLPPNLRSLLPPPGDLALADLAFVARPLAEKLLDALNQQHTSSPDRPLHAREAATMWLITTLRAQGRHAEADLLAAAAPEPR